MRHFRQTIDVVRRLAEEGQSQSMKGQWTLGQLCDHLAKSVEGSCPNGGMGPPAVPAPLRPILKYVILWTGRMPSGVDVPPTLAPGDDASVDEAIERLAVATAAFEAIPESQRSSMPPHPVFGRMSYADWQRLHRIHCRHHLKRFTGAWW